MDWLRSNKTNCVWYSAFEEIEGEREKSERKLSVIRFFSRAYWVLLATMLVAVLGQLSHTHIISPVLIYSIYGNYL